MIDGGDSANSTLDGDVLSSLRGQLQDDHEARAALCADLEQMADALPTLPPPARVRRICNQIECVTSGHFRRAETILAGAAAARNAPSASATLELLTGMHVMDAVHGEDLITALWDSTARGSVVRPGEFGYMLRCFFDGCRRAIALENLLLNLFEHEARETA